jgi:hypothetical protein
VNKIDGLSAIHLTNEIIKIENLQDLILILKLNKIDKNEINLIN